MALTHDDCSCIKAIWPNIASHAEQYGGEALYRMFLCSPQTKTYFPNFDFHKESPQIMAQGKKVIDAVTNASKHLDNIEGALDKLSDLHAFTLRVDPGNFTMLCHQLLVTIAYHFPDKFDCHTHQALDKFLARVCGALTHKYR